MQKLEAIIFDFNGVIADDLEISLDVFVELAERHGKHYHAQCLAVVDKMASQLSATRRAS